MGEYHADHKNYYSKFEWVTGLKMKITIESVLIRLILGTSIILSPTAVWSSTMYTYTGNNFDTFETVGSLN